MAEDYQRILVIDLLGGLGDLLLILPAIHALAAAHPGGRLRVLTHRHGDQLLRTDPAVAATRTCRRGGEAVAVDRELRSFQPDLVVSSTRHSGIPDRINATGCRAVTDLWRRPPADQRVEQRYLEILRAEGLIDKAAAGDGAVMLTPEEIDAGAKAVGSRPSVVLLPTAGMAVKEWPLARWAALAGNLSALGVPVSVCAERTVELETATTLPATTLRGVAGYLAAVARNGGVVVGADTGPLRLAAAVGGRVVGLFGPSTRERYGLAGAINLQGLPGCPHRVPLAITEAPCWWTADCPLGTADPACLRDIGVETVSAAVLDLLAG